MSNQVTEKELKEFIAEIKHLLALEDVSYKELAERINKEYGASESQPNLSKKVLTGSLRYVELKRWAKVLGYKIKWEKE